MWKEPRSHTRVKVEKLCLNSPWLANRSMTSRDPLIKVMWAATRKFRRIQHGGGTEVLWPVSCPAVNTEFCSVTFRHNLFTGRVFFFLSCSTRMGFKVLWEVRVSKRSFGPAAGRRQERQPDSSSEVNNRQRLTQRDLRRNITFVLMFPPKASWGWRLDQISNITWTEITPNSIQNTANLALL